MTQDFLPPSLQEMLQKGALFDGKYRLVRAIGQGSFASVIHARHETMDRDVAIKVLRPDVIDEHPDVGERFINEGRLASRLTSAHTVMIFDFGETEEGIPYMVLEYVDGRPLDYAMDKYGALGLKRSVRITMQVLESLEEAHSHNIIHRDLKPANVMVGKGMKKQKEGVHVKVLDFGVAKLVDETESDDAVEPEDSGRHSTQFIGTPRYMSPEQILGREVSPGSDLYSLGLIFFEMCTGRPSVPGDNVARVAQAHLAEGPLQLAGIEEVPGVLREVIWTATGRDPEDRYSSAGAFRQDLEAALEQGRNRHQEVRSTAEPTPNGDGVESADGSRRRSDVFSGDGYVEAPSQEFVESTTSSASGTNSRPPSPGSSPRSPSRPPSPKSARRSRSASATDRSPSRRRSTPATDTASSHDDSELELDMESVERQKRNASRERRRRRKQEQRPRQGDQSQWKGWLGSISVIAAAGYIGFVVVGAALTMFGVSMRLLLGIFPVGLALLWAIFSENAYPDRVRRLMIPWAKRSVVMALSAVLLLAVVMPGDAAEGLRSQALWFMQGWPESLQMSWLKALTEVICDSTAWFMELLQGLVPWS